MKKVFNFSILFITLLVYSSTYIPPDRFWPAGFISYLIPAAVLFNLLLLAYRIRKFQLNIIFPALALLIGFYFLRNTVSISKRQTPGDIRVLSYNTKVFNVYKDNGNDTASVSQMINWINGQPADIMCFQEFYNNPHSEYYNTIDKINRNNRFHVFHRPLFTNRRGSQFGATIFSRYPILSSGILNFTEGTQNNVIFADLLLNVDTIRVYNMHLQSMHINENDMINAEDYQAEFQNLTGRLKYGFIQRAEQIRLLKAHMKECPYPILLCGDLNDIPYSYAYRELDEVLNNGFSNAGNGFGFTFNGKMFFLRIDNQFFSNRFDIHTFKTHRDIGESDHFPVSATYTIKPR